MSLFKFHHFCIIVCVVYVCVIPYETISTIKIQTSSITLRLLMVTFYSQSHHYLLPPSPALSSLFFISICLLLQECYVNRVTQYVIFYIGCFPVSIMSLMLVHIVCINIWFMFSLEYYCMTWMQHSLFNLLI